MIFPQALDLSSDELYVRPATMELCFSKYLMLSSP